METITYRQWHEEGTFKFNVETMVSFSQCDRNKNLSVHELLKLTSDIAVEDFNQRNMSRDTLTAAGYAILVSRNSFNIHRIPVENEFITVSTWEEKSEPFQFIRAYEIKDSKSNEKLVTGLSTWLLVDLNNRRLLPIKKFTMREPLDTVTEHDCLKPEKISLPENMTHLEDRKIRYSDLDANGHTNNARYGAFAFDAIPDEFKEKKLKALRINYSQEALYDQNLEIKADLSDSEKLTVAGFLNNGEKPVSSFECEFYF
ncbi:MULTISPECIES: acyl-ACP thioesterase domain-containing protein [Treponema]|uniref:Acyl-ACP thioesterase n=1 Tax=Treponema rectale TaxID=744512 RepID=A0A840S9B5_9SPIR|nr:MULTISPECIES: acyl-ACP thioesterase domain-containing protein [Treponema]MBB5219279.1 acyl-ACP thioesterase [Treponema rectale]MBE6354791.1 acyl-[acyl-carrier-protein] thioesterase [Treponema sp.]MBO6177041.1 acyl-[acyl-carrier-protein] thioesterase [Treponema sp.]QOS40836.1 acyl-[acyl-carrier-protein] thioesterase [Treponema rectale]